MNKKLFSQILIIIGLLAGIFMFPSTFQLNEMEGLGGMILYPFIFALYLFLFITQVASIIALVKSKNPGILIFLSSLPASFLSTATYENQDSFFKSIPMFVLLFSILLSYVFVNFKNLKKPKYILGLLTVLTLFTIIYTSYSILDKKNQINENESTQALIDNASIYSECDALKKIYQTRNCAQSVLDKTGDIIGCINYSADRSPIFEERYSWWKSGIFPCSYMGTNFSKIGDSISIGTIKGNSNWSTYSNDDFVFKYRNGFIIKEFEDKLVVNPNIYESPSITIQTYKDTIENVVDIISAEYANESLYKEELNSNQVSNFTINGNEARQLRFNLENGFDDINTLITKNNKVYRIQYSNEENSELFEILLYTFVLKDS